MEMLEAETRGDHGIIFKKVGPELSVIEGGFTTNVPSQALAISNKFGLTFFLHSEGFCVTYTKKLVESSQSLVDSPKKTLNAQEGCLVSVSLCSPQSLHLSKDELVIAACTPDGIHFYSVPALVQKENLGKGAILKSLEYDVDVKCLEWNDIQNDLVLVLSREGVLRIGSFRSELKLVAKDAEAADWSPDGEYLCYVTTNMELHTCKSNMSQNSSFKLPEQMFFEAPSGGLEAYVDTLKWVCMDSVLIACVHKNEDGDEDDYWLFLLIANKGHVVQIHDGCQVLSFSQLFTSIDTSIIPPGTGPYLLASYIEPWKIIIATSRRSIDDHISLVGWMDKDEKLEACKLELEDDRFTPRIELQDSGDDNCVVGLVVDHTTSSIQLPALTGEPGEKLPAGPVLICMTIEGNLSLFSVARTDVKWSSVKVISSPLPLPAVDEFAISNGLQIEIKDLGEKIQEPEVQVQEIISGKNKEQIEKGPLVTIGKDGKFLWEGVKFGGIMDVEVKGTFPKDKNDKERFQKGSDHDIQRRTPFPQPQKSFIPDAGREMKTERLNNIQMHQSVIHAIPDQKPLGAEKKLTAAEKDQKVTPASPTSEIESDFEKVLTKVKLMAEEIDALLEFIEKKTIDMKYGTKPLFTKSLMEEIECETQELSLECQKFWENLMEQRKNINNLRDESMQADAWRVYLQSVVEQVSDVRYQEIWNNQKLHPEMDATRKRILQMDQSLKQQIAELEGHLHNLELSNWQKRKQLKRLSVSVPQSPEKFHHIQSLYETVNTQMLVAQQLDHRLKQLSEALKLSKGVKEEIETLIERSHSNIECLTLEEYPSKKTSDAFTRTKAFAESSEFTAFSPLKTSVNMSMQTPTKLDASSGMRTGLQDSTRRRRDSVDQLWVDVGAAKTTVKRTATAKHFERPSTPPKAIQPLHEKEFRRSPQYHLNGTKDTTRNGSATSTIGPREDMRKLERGTASLQVIARQKMPASSMSESSTFAWQQGIALTTAPASIKETTASDALKGRTLEAPLMSTISRPAAPQTISKISKPTAPAPQVISIINRPTAPQSTSISSRPTAQFISTTSRPTAQFISTTSRPTASPTVRRPTLPKVSGSMHFGSKTVPETESQYPLKMTSEFHFQTTSRIQSEMPTEATDKHQTPLQRMQLSDLSSEVLLTQDKVSESKKEQLPFERHFSVSPGTSVSVDDSSLQGSSTMEPFSISDMKIKEEANNISLLSSPEVSMPQHPKVPVADTDVLLKLGVTSAVSSPSVISTMPPAIVPPVNVLSSTSVTSIVSTASSPSIGVTSKTPSLPSNGLMQTTQLLEATASSVNVQGPTISDEEDMEEEENVQIDFGAPNFAGFGLGSAVSSSGPQLSTAFGVSTVWTESSSAASSLPAGQLFKPASFSIPSAESTPQQGSSLFRPASFSISASASSQPMSSNLFGNSFTAPNAGFGVASSPFGNSSQPTAPAFGQQLQTASSGQQVLGSALGTFGQTRQIGSPFGISPSPTGVGFAGVTTGSGLATLTSTGGGFAGVASTGGGFAGVASTGGGFAGIASTGGGFAGIASAGFASSAAGGGGFAGFSGAAAFGGGFSSFGTNANSSVFTQMRK